MNNNILDTYKKLNGCVKSNCKNETAKKYINKLNCKFDNCKKLYILNTKNILDFVIKISKDKKNKFTNEQLSLLNKLKSILNKSNITFKDFIEIENIQKKLSVFK